MRTERMRIVIEQVDNGYICVTEPVYPSLTSPGDYTSGMKDGREQVVFQSPEQVAEWVSKVILKRMRSG